MKKAFILSGLALVLLFGVGYFMISNKEEVLSYANISINPNMELVVNEDNIVKEVIAYNEEAELVLANLDYDGLTIEEATKNIISIATELGYIDVLSAENDIVITVYGDNEGQADELANDMLEVAEEFVEENKIPAVVTKEGITDEIKVQAEELGITNGKMLFLIKKQEILSDYTLEELANMEVKDVVSLVKDNKLSINKENARKEEVQNKIQEANQIKEQVKEEIQNRVQTAVETRKQENINETALREEALEQAKQARSNSNNKNN